LHGQVQINYREELSVSAEIKTGDILSVRGAGKFIIEEIAGETRSGRIKVNVKRYV
jgi:RNA-binding protein YlmH